MCNYNYGGLFVRVLHDPLNPMEIPMSPFPAATSDLREGLAFSFVTLCPTGSTFVGMARLASGGEVDGSLN